jgi:hypothetical protein
MLVLCRLISGDTIEDQFEKFINLGDDRNIVEVRALAAVPRTWFAHVVLSAAPSAPASALSLPLYQLLGVTCVTLCVDRTLTSQLLQAPRPTLYCCSVLDPRPPGVRGGRVREARGHVHRGRGRRRRPLG